MTAVHFFLSISDVDPSRRLSSSEAMEHPYLVKGPTAPLASMAEISFISGTIRRLEAQRSGKSTTLLPPAPKLVKSNHSHPVIWAIPPEYSNGPLHTGQWLQEDDGEVQYLTDPRSAEVQYMSSMHANIPRGWNNDNTTSALFIKVEVQPVPKTASLTVLSDDSYDGEWEEVEIPGVGC
jgi:serine/threonine protein kinase